MTVYYTTVGCKLPHPGKRQDRFCTDDKETKEVAIPASWELNELQRSFIDLMINEPGKQ